MLDELLRNGLVKFFEKPYNKVKFLKVISDIIQYNSYLKAIYLFKKVDVYQLSYWPNLVLLKRV